MNTGQKFRDNHAPSAMDVLRLKFFLKDHLSMLYISMNNLGVTVRHLARQRLNTAVHVVGLTLGMSVCLLIGLFLRYELSFDAYHHKAGRTYRINSVVTDGGQKKFHFATPIPLASALRAEVAGLENVALVHQERHAVVEINTRELFKQDDILVVEPEFLDVFNIEVLKGDAWKALAQPYQALLTETTAKKFFGQEDPVGKTFKYKNDFIITVAGVIRDLPSNTHLPASMLLSFIADEKFLGQNPEGWFSIASTSAYVVLPEYTDPKKLEVPLKNLADKNINPEPGLPKNVRSDLELQPLRAIHLDPKFAGGGAWVHAINPSWLWFFGSIGIAVLILACINFINLSTAQAITRAKEIGVRKSVGAGRFNLMGQFLREAWMLSFVAGVLSIAIVQLLLPAFNTLLEEGITFDLLRSPGLLLALIAGIILTGLLAGLYPAWVIARMNPVITLKTGSTVAGDQGSLWLRKVLMTAQFTISGGLLIALLLIAQQVTYMRTKNLGFDKDNIVTVELGRLDKAPVFAFELSRIPQVSDVSFSTAAPSSEGHWGTIMSLTNGDDPARQQVTMIGGDDHYCTLYGLHLLSGRFPQASDTNYISHALPWEKRIIKVTVNEKLVQALGFDSNEAALGKHFWIGMNSGNSEIIGVVADFNTTSLHDAVKPALILQFPGVYSQAGIKIQAGADMPQTMAAIETAWKKAFPDGVFEFTFLDEKIDAFYKAEARLYTLFKIFAGLAIMISCLGLWGLATFSAQQRTKEIGIRKVLGASVNAIILLLSKDFLLMVIIALVIASPVSYFLMQRWLESFAYRISIGWQVFVVAGIVSVLLALLTVSLQALKAALANPAKSLRTE